MSYYDRLQHNQVSMSTICVFIFTVLISCGGDDPNISEEWVGTWTVLGLSGDANIAFTKNEWEFKGNGTWRAEFTMEVRDDPDLRITMKGSGDYAVLNEDYTITAKKLDVDFSKKAKEVFNINEQQVRQLISGILKEPGSGTTTGTWRRRGDTLTLMFSRGEVSVFQKK